MLQMSLTFPSRRETAVTWAKSLVDAESYDSPDKKREELCEIVSRRAGLKDTTVWNLLYRTPKQVKDEVYAGLARLVVRAANRQIERLINEREFALRACRGGSAIELKAISEDIEALRAKLKAVAEGQK